MAKDKEKRPIVIVRKKKVVGGGHHGGSWKVAYADFVTCSLYLRSYRGSTAAV